jgi:hypothetical protein
MTLQEAVSIDDALDFIKRGFTKEQHLSCFKARHHEAEAKAWDVAQELVQRLGTVRKAQNYIGKEIDSHR